MLSYVLQKYSFGLDSLLVIPGNVAAIIAGYLAIFALIAQIVGSVLYILYLHNAYRALEAVIPPEEQVQQMM